MPSLRKPPAKRRTRGTKAQTRARLLQAALDLLEARGEAAVTTVGVTQKAGIAQSAFYQHFANVEECLAAVAEQITNEIRTFVADARRKRLEAASGAGGQLEEAYRNMFKLASRQRSIHRLFLRLPLRSRGTQGRDVPFRTWLERRPGGTTYPTRPPIRSQSAFFRVDRGSGRQSGRCEPRGHRSASGPPRPSARGVGQVARGIHPRSLECRARRDAVDLICHLGEPGCNCRDAAGLHRRRPRIRGRTKTVTASKTFLSHGVNAPLFHCPRILQAVEHAAPVPGSVRILPPISGRFVPFSQPEAKFRQNA